MRTLHGFVKGMKRVDIQVVHNMVSTTDGKLMVANANVVAILHATKVAA